MFQRAIEIYDHRVKTENDNLLSLGMTIHMIRKRHRLKTNTEHDNIWKLFNKRNIFEIKPSFTLSNQECSSMLPARFNNSWYLYEHGLLLNPCLILKHMFAVNHISIYQFNVCNNDLLVSFRIHLFQLDFSYIMMIASSLILDSFVNQSVPG